MQKELEANGRQVFDPETLMYDERKRRVTNLQECSRVTTQLGDLTRLTTKVGDSTSTSGLDDRKEVTRYGSQISRGPPMPRTEREGSQTGTNTTRITVQLGNMTRSTTQPGSMTKLKETSVTGEEQATAAEESNYGSGEAEISSGPHALYIEQE